MTGNGAESAPHKELRFTHTAISPTNPGSAGAIPVGIRRYGRAPPIQAETNFNNASNPQGHARLPKKVTELASMRASSVMLMSMKPAFNGVANHATPKPSYTNTNSAQPWLKTYGAAWHSGNASHAEASVFAMGGGGPALLNAHSNKNRAVVKEG